MNAAIKRNAALGGKRKFLGDPTPVHKRKSKQGIYQSATDATRKTLKDKYKEEARADRLRELSATLIGVLVGLFLLYYHLSNETATLSIDRHTYSLTHTGYEPP